MIDGQALEIGPEDITHDPQRQLGLAVDEHRRSGAGGPALNRRPELLEQGEVAGELLLGGPFGGGANDDASLGQLERPADGLEPLPLVVVEAP